MECSARTCPVELATDTDNSSTAPITIPQKTYYKCQRQIEERARIQYHRQLYRAQMDAAQQQAGHNMQAQQALLAQQQKI
ncbi:hypothetical protein HYH02_012179 [Chlamydomonas schloesseri]|uniref:Uncharacterized protein n=1 Tax=Chlamydomonas schloesseri TaxID=2026947 RepID=A0A835SWB6_9CHLO|nr:hypothetical protein HYH02_012179 [Chlamydomonas schloesseri]|eukprot:KAG2434512.1 hypothetical protein HYH02_012179 [Chlamydomonas schloesseri]